MRFRMGHRQVLNVLREDTDMIAEVDDQNWDWQCVLQIEIVLFTQ